MLFLLTGPIRLGKTRWLLQQLEALEAAGVQVGGVVAPGVWQPAPVSERCPHGFDKRAIEAVLYPGHERHTLAMRRDLVEGEDFSSQRLPGEKMEWDFSDQVMETINCHFARLMAVGTQPASCGQGSSDGIAPSDSAPGLLVVDEVGRLELRGKGLTQAVAALTAGPTPAYPHMLAIVRDALLESALELFEPVWGQDIRVIHPDEEGAQALRTIIVG